jgi:hypothetical protein
MQLADGMACSAWPWGGLPGTRPGDRCRSLRCNLGSGDFREACHFELRSDH